MILKLLLSTLLFLAIFLFYVSTKDGHFSYQRSGLINSTPEVIFPYISNFKLGTQWNSYDQKDPNTKRNFIGNDGAVGSIMEFSGNNDAGTGKVEILKLESNQKVEIRLIMTKPLNADNLITYTLTPEGASTKFTIAMSGDGGYIGKLMGTIIDCEKMVTKEFDISISNLKRLIEYKK